MEPAVSCSWIKIEIRILGRKFWFSFGFVPPRFEKRSWELVSVREWGIKSKTKHEKDDPIKLTDEILI